MKILKFIVLLLLAFYYSLITAIPVSAHFVKSNNGIGTVLHIDPEDDPIAGQQSTMILEFKDTNDKLNLNNCDCKVLVTQDSKEVINQSFKGASESENLTAIIPVTFPEKNIYHLKLIGIPNSGANFSNFELNYDIRVGRDNTSAPAVKEESWFSGHMIHLIGGGVIIAFLIGALIAQNKKKMAVIILVLLLLAHSMPIKAIHAAHSSSLDSGAFECCLPVPAVAADPVVVSHDIIPHFEEPVYKILNFKFQILNSLTIRPPPFS